MDILRAPRVSLLARPQFLEPAHLPVAWNGPSSDGERIAEFAGRLCYMSQSNPAGRTTEGYLQNILKQGHGSVFEHSQYVVLLEGISRSCTHELVRHRAGFGYCLTGETRVRLASGRGTSRQTQTLRSLWKLASTAAGRARLAHLSLCTLDETTGTFTSAGIAAIAQSGLKHVFRVDLADGRSITCSADHRFLTPDGWQPLREIVGGLGLTPAGTAAYGHLQTPLLCEPAAARTPGARTEACGAPGGAHRSALQLTGATAGTTWTRSTPDGDRDATARPGETPIVVGICSVTAMGEQMTYDIEMAGAHPNFVANGIVTHNSQLSQRYVDESRAAYVLPPAIIGNTALEAAWTAQMHAAHAAYVAQVEGLMQQYAHVADAVHRRKMAREAARSVLPNATETKIVVSGNVRAWRTMLELRLCEGAELEIRRLSLAILALLTAEAPALFGDFELFDAPDGTKAGRVAHHKV